MHNFFEPCYRISIKLLLRRTLMLHDYHQLRKVLNVQVSDTTGDATCAEARQQKLMIAIITMCLLVYPAKAIISKMCSNDQERRRNKKPKLVLMPNLFADK